MEDKLLDKGVMYMTINIGLDPILNKPKKLLVSASGTRFTVMVENNIYGEYQLKTRLTEKNRLKFVLENPFEPDKIFDCNENITLNVIGWIIERETRVNVDEIS